MSVTNYVTITVTNTVTVTNLPTVTTLMLDQAYRCSTATAQDIVKRYRGRVITP